MTFRQLIHHIAIQYENAKAFQEATLTPNGSMDDLVDICTLTPDLFRTDMYKSSEVTYIPTDVSKLADLRHLVETTRLRYGRIKGQAPCLF